MRLPLIQPNKLSAEQQSLYADMRASVGTHFQGFISVCDDGSFTGPWNAWLHWPKVGQATWELVKQVMAMSTLAKRCHEITILATAAHFKAGCEVCAHVAIAQNETDLNDEAISSIISGQRPDELSREEALAYDVAAALLRRGPLPELTFKLAKEAFGADGIAELIFLVGRQKFRVSGPHLSFQSSACGPVRAPPQVPKDRKQS